MISWNLGREEAGYCSQRYPVVQRQDEAAYGRYRTRDLILGYIAAYTAGDLDALVKG